VKDDVEVCIQKEQAGFWKHRSFVDLINTLRIILEQSAEWQTTLYLNFIDFGKAFDSQKTVSEYGIPPPPKKKKNY
jgi:hypothetical protein